MPFDYKSFITHYIGIPVYIFGYLGYKSEHHPPLIRHLWKLLIPALPVIRKTKAVNIPEMDLTTGAREFADLEGEDEDDGYSEMHWKQKIVYNLKNW